MKLMYIDCGMGAAGDMLTGALLELLDIEHPIDGKPEIADQGRKGSGIYPDPLYEQYIDQKVRSRCQRRRDPDLLRLHVRDVDPAQIGGDRREQHRDVQDRHMIIGLAVVAADQYPEEHRRKECTKTWWPS